MLPLHHQPSLSYVVTQHSAVVFSTVPTTSFCVVIRTYTEFTCIIKCLRSQPLTRFFATAQLPSNEAYRCQLRPGVCVSSVVRVVGHLGIEPRTSDLSGLRANRLCQCPMKLPLCQLLYVTGHRETDYIFYMSKLTLYLALLYIEFSSQGYISFQLAWAKDCRHPSVPCSHSHIGWISYFYVLARVSFLDQ